MSPEQGSGDGTDDRRSDIYALGCVLYEMLAGEPPFTGRTAQSILARHRQDTPPPLHTVRPGLPPAIESSVERALAKIPADRFPTASAFAASLTAPATTGNLRYSGAEPPESYARPRVDPGGCRHRGGGTDPTPGSGVRYAFADRGGCPPVRQLCTRSEIRAVLRTSCSPRRSTGCPSCTRLMEPRFSKPTRMRARSPYPNCFAVPLGSEGRTS